MVQAQADARREKSKVKRTRKAKTDGSETATAEDQE